MPQPMPGGKVEKNAQRHLRQNDELDVTDCIEIARLVALGKKDAALERLAVMAKRNQRDSAVGLYLELNQLSDADDVIMAATAEARRQSA
jgi:hypothetical protein